MNFHFLILLRLFTRKLGKSFNKSVIDYVEYRTGDFPVVIPFGSRRGIRDKLAIRDR